MSSGMMYEPEWPVPPVTKTRMLLLLVGDLAEEMVVRVRSAEKVDAEGEVEVPHAMAGQADHQQARPFQGCHLGLTALSRPSNTWIGDR
jgi:hypothetical protein